MQAIVMRDFGGPDVLEAAQLATPDAKPGSVRVRVEAVGVNYYDTLVRSGAVCRAIPLPHVVGSDVVGRVDAVGAGVRGFALGERVIVAPGWPSDPKEWDAAPENEAPSYYPTGTFTWGGYAEFMDVPARWLLPDDTGMAAEELASIPLVLVTAVHAVRTQAGVRAGDRVLVQGGASGAGSMAIQIAKALGARVIATASTPAKAELARRLGADAVVAYREQDVAASVREWSGGAGVDAVIDPVGGATLAGSLASLRPRGVLVNLGLAAGAEAAIPHLYPFFRNELRIVGSWMGSMDELRFGLDLVKAGRVRGAVDRVLPLSSAREAHQRVERADVVGKLVLRPGA